MVDHTQTIRGPAALDAHARGFCANIPDVKIEVQRIFATDDTVVGIFDIEDGKLVEYRAFVDAVDTRTQIVAPAAGRGDE